MGNDTQLVTVELAGFEIMKKFINTLCDPYVSYLASSE